MGRYYLDKENEVIISKTERVLHDGVPLIEKYEVPTSETADSDKGDKMMEDLERVILSTVGKDK